MKSNWFYKLFWYVYQELVLLIFADDRHSRAEKRARPEEVKKILEEYESATAKVSTTKNNLDIGMIIYFFIVSN